MSGQSSICVFGVLCGSISQRRRQPLPGSWSLTSLHEKPCFARNPDQITLPHSQRALRAMENMDDGNNLAARFVNSVE